MNGSPSHIDVCFDALSELYEDHAWEAYQLLQHEDNRATQQTGYSNAESFDLYMQIYHQTAIAGSGDVQFISRQIDKDLIVPLGDKYAVGYLTKLTKDLGLCVALSQVRDHSCTLA